MVGFLGEQVLLSHAGLGANVEEHATTTLKNGTVITAYFSSNGGPLKFSSFNPKTAETTILDVSMGVIGSRMSDPNIFARDDGGFTVVLNFPVGNSIGDDRLMQYNFDKDGNYQSFKELATGWLDVGDVFKTDTGFFATYRDRTADAAVEHVGAFYNQNGKLLKTFDFAADLLPTDYPWPRPHATELSNGNLAVVWHKNNTDGSLLQIFKPNGNKVGSEKSLGNIPPKYAASVVEALPDGGFAVAHAPPALTNGTSRLAPIVIQKYTNSGKKMGKEISFDTDGGVGAALTYSEFDIAFTKGGLIAVAWTGNGVGGSDVYFAMLSATGKVIVGPQAADVTLNDDQLEVQFTTLKNGDIFLTFKDDATVQFQFVSSIQGRFIQDPDYYWEGKAKADIKNGTNGDDIMLGLGGNDTIKTGKGEDYVKGGKGNDKLFGEARKDVLLGEDGTDLIYGGSGDDSLYGGNGNDRLYGGANNDALFGGGGFDTLIGGLGADTLYGGLGNDKLVAGSKSSTLYGGDGRDNLLGKAGSDTMYGEAGNDKITGRLGNDYLDGAEGNDKLFGGDGFDVLRGGDGKDTLYGGNDDDAFYSGDGNDLEFGGAGKDRFYDSKGNDRMQGGADADTFIFANTDFGKDVITDFEFGVDKLDMRTTATSLNATSQTISIVEVANGVRFVVDADNWVLIKGAALSDFQADDYDLTPWY